MKTIQVRNVPDDVHHALRVSAAAAGISTRPGLSRRHLLGGRIWQLRHDLTAYDAAFVALAEALGAPLVTCDGKLAHAPGHGARIELFVRGA